MPKRHQPRPQPAESVQQSRRHYDERRPERHRFYHNKRWARFRAWFLSHPENALCAICKSHGLTLPAVIVDHKETIEDRPDLALVAANCQGLCQSCHNQKTARQRAKDSN